MRRRGKSATPKSLDCDATVVSASQKPKTTSKHKQTTEESTPVARLREASTSSRRQKSSARKQLVTTEPSTPPRQHKSRSKTKRSKKDTPKREGEGQVLEESRSSAGGAQASRKKTATVVRKRVETVATSSAAAMRCGNVTVPPNTSAPPRRRSVRIKIRRQQKNISASHTETDAAVSWFDQLHEGQDGDHEETMAESKLELTQAEQDATADSGQLEKESAVRRDEHAGGQDASQVTETEQDKELETEAGNGVCVDKIPVFCLPPLEKSAIAASTEQEKVSEGAKVYKFESRELSPEPMPADENENRDMVEADVISAQCSPNDELEIRRAESDANTTGLREIVVEKEEGGTQNDVELESDSDVISAQTTSSHELPETCEARQVESTTIIKEVVKEGEHEDGYCTAKETGNEERMVAPAHGEPGASTTVLLEEVAAEEENIHQDRPKTPEDGKFAEQQIEGATPHVQTVKKDDTQLEQSEEVEEQEEDYTASCDDDAEAEPDETPLEHIEPDATHIETVQKDDAQEGSCVHISHEFQEMEEPEGYNASQTTSETTPCNDNVEAALQGTCVEQIQSDTVQVELEVLEAQSAQEEQSCLHKPSKLDGDVEEQDHDLQEVIGTASQNDVDPEAGTIDASEQVAVEGQHLDQQSEADHSSEADQLNAEVEIEVDQEGTVLSEAYETAVESPEAPADIHAVQRADLLEEPCIEHNSCPQFQDSTTVCVPEWDTTVQELVATPGTHVWLMQQSDAVEGSSIETNLQQFHDAVATQESSIFVSSQQNLEESLTESVFHDAVDMQASVVDLEEDLLQAHAHVGEEVIVGEDASLAHACSPNKSTEDIKCLTETSDFMQSTDEDGKLPFMETLSYDEVQQVEQRSDSSATMDYDLDTDIAEHSSDSDVILTAVERRKRQCDGNRKLEFSSTDSSCLSSPKAKRMRNETSPKRNLKAVQIDLRTMTAQDIVALVERRAAPPSGSTSGRHSFGRSRCKLHARNITREEANEAVRKVASFSQKQIQSLQPPALDTSYKGLTVTKAEQAVPTGPRQVAKRKVGRPKKTKVVNAKKAVAKVEVVAEASREQMKTEDGTANSASKAIPGSGVSCKPQNKVDLEPFKVPELTAIRQKAVLHWIKFECGQSVIPPRDFSLERKVTRMSACCQFEEPYTSAFALFLMNSFVWQFAEIEGRLLPSYDEEGKVLQELIYNHEVEMDFKWSSELVALEGEEHASSEKRLSFLSVRHADVAEFDHAAILYFAKKPCLKWGDDEYVQVFPKHSPIYERNGNRRSVPLLKIRGLNVVYESKEELTVLEMFRRAKCALRELAIKVASNSLEVLDMAQLDLEDEEDAKKAAAPAAVEQMDTDSADVTSGAAQQADTDAASAACSSQVPTEAGQKAPDSTRLLNLVKFILSTHAQHQDRSLRLYSLHACFVDWFSFPQVVQVLLIFCMFRLKDQLLRRRAVVPALNIDFVWLQSLLSGYPCLVKVFSSLPLLPTPSQPTVLFQLQHPFTLCIHLDYLPVSNLQ